MYHTPVLLNEVIEGLFIKPEGIYIDATFGRGGHSQAILSHLNEKGRLLAMDKDWDAIHFAKETIKDDRFSLQQGSFTMLREWVESQQLQQKIDGILLDLGVSSPQLDTPERGFSFLRDGPLDMRMDTSKGVSAEVWINQAPATEIADVLKKYGEERYSRRIAQGIVETRQEAPITSTLQLADIIKAFNPSWEKEKHPATRSFQAIRIFINQELQELESCLAQCIDVLGKGGRLAVISFHSLEDRIVKRFLRRQAKGEEFPKDLPIMASQSNPTIKIMNKAQRASMDEVKQNPRARSAVLRVAEKIT